MSSEPAVAVVEPRKSSSLVRFGHAPGGYMRRCCSCDHSFDGDKRATQCLDCAVKKMGIVSRGKPYGVLRVALRGAIQRLVGTSVPDISVIFRAIESGELDHHSATGAIEQLLHRVIEEEAKR